ncbi:MAG: HD domain-containing protein, partial [Clostridiales bacterium]|nr:HD domain-containing protein [Clostridiales bacterium]
MFFTNGGVEGGAPIWLLLGTFYIALILEGKFKAVMFFCEGAVMLGCWIVGYYFPQYVTTYSRWGNYFDTIVALLIVSVIICVIVTFYISLSKKEEEQKNVQRLFTQTATALVKAIDAKDKYTHGHSSRVADYSRRIAVELGKSPRECDDIYYVALLHDVGKIGIPEKIINKEGKLTDEEYSVIKQHSAL